MGEVGCVYLNFGLWGVSLIPAWFVIKEIGAKYSKAKGNYHRNRVVDAVESEASVVDGKH